MGEVGNAGHLDLDRNGDLALDLLGAAARPLGDDLNVVIGHIGVGFDGQRAKCENAPRGEHRHTAQHQPAALQREIDERADHLVPSPGFRRSTRWVQGGFLFRKKPLGGRGIARLRMANRITGSPRFQAGERW